MFRLGEQSFNGKDYAKAREWYQKAADAGNAPAMYALGELYYSGQGVGQDYSKTHEWFQKAADAGDTIAMYGLGWLYQHGQGVARG
jgi:uncharacterized protein